MRNIKFIIIIFLFSKQVVGQTNIQLVINNLGSHKIEKVDVFDLSQKEFYKYEYKDTLTLNFNKKNIDCYNIRYYEGDKMFKKQIWLDTGKIKIIAHLDNTNLIIDTVFNSPSYYKILEFEKKYSELVKKNDTTSINNYLLDKYEENIENPYSLLIGNFYISLNQNSKLNLIKFKTLVDKQGAKFEWFLFYPVVKGRLNKILTIDKIDISKFTLIDQKNKNIKISLNGSDLYLLDFWFLACIPCVKDHIQINRKLNLLRQNKIEIISISTDENFKPWNDYLEKNNYNWQNYLQVENWSITKELSITTFPTYIIINNNGEIINTYNSFSDVLRRFKIDE